jgi:ABC-type multidrug transport system ATPase subunit
MTPLATFDNLTKRYEGGVAVDRLSFAVPEGQVCGLLGPNGAGKTTAIRALLGLVRPSGGGTTLLGRAPGEAGFAASLRRVGTLIEGPALYGRATARQNMLIEADALGLESAAAEIEDLLELVGLSDRANTRCASFSLGMKQRLGLAIALMGRPRLVVLDEPTNGLDPAGIVEIRDLIARLPERGTSVLLSSHMLSEIQLICHRAVILQRGRLLAEGTIGELLGKDDTAGYTASVDPSETDRALGALRRAGLAAHGGGDGVIEVSGEIETGEAVSHPLAQAGIPIRELKHRRADLEQVFLQLTRGSNGTAPDERAAVGAAGPREVPDAA